MKVTNVNKFIESICESLQEIFIFNDVQHYAQVRCNDDADYIKKDGRFYLTSLKNVIGFVSGGKTLYIIADNNAVSIYTYVNEEGYRRYEMVHILLYDLMKSKTSYMMMLTKTLMELTKEVA